ncbi:MAG: NAD+ synthase [Actinobacteria bacterium]|nr:NAD+ synthase [Actinomycetota bacterium]
MDLVKQIVGWIRKQVEEAGASGAVFGMSGGLDSSIVAALCHKSVTENALGAILPCYSDPVDLEDARLVAEQLGITKITVDLCPVFDALLAQLPKASDSAVINLKPRLRMMTLYYIAKEKGYLVVGTGNKSEIEVGYFTKYGDGGVDILPLASTYKTDLGSMAGELGIPARIIDKVPSAGLWAGQTDEREMGITYAVLDDILKAIETHQETEAESELVKKVKGMVDSSAHKRSLPTCFSPEQDNNCGSSPQGY